MSGETKEIVPDRRRSSLTEADLLAISSVIKHHSNCNLGWTSDEVAEFRNHRLTTEELDVIKKFVGLFNKAANVIGTVILSAIGAALVAIITKGWWASIASGIKQGAGK
jgi:hypothetical protein